MTKFQKLINFINTHSIGEIITRKEIIKEIETTGEKYTIDIYRRTLTRENYLERIGQGKYKLIKKIPQTLISTANGFHEDQISKVLKEFNKAIIQSERGEES